ncbi:MAG: transcriptional regulator NrdR [Coriobacteriales bacterium]|jgi:transcriptional repressor NrdR|nr:transcriptional regulator NrdR [Coriobacteriales bacterium]
MRCPECGSVDDKVIDSRPSEDGLSIRRRRECLECAHRFTTDETYRKRPLIVVKKDKSAEAFDRDKLLRGLMRATVKRGIPVSKLEDLIEDVEKTLRDRIRNDVRAEVLGELVLERLRELDDVAYIRFASVYKDFRNVEEFQMALKGLK